MDSAKTELVNALLERAGAGAAVRRAPLLAAMSELGAKGVNCAGCAGTCCTFVANSMQITPLETLELLHSLEASGAWNEATIQKLCDVTAANGLDRAPAGDGRREWTRKRYTCPFFAGAALGCQIAPTAKPLGCLAFNPRRANVAGGEDCGGSDQLLARDTVARDELALATAAASALAFEKLPIPVALLRAEATRRSRAT